MGVPESQIRIRKGKFNTKTLSRAFNWLHDLSISKEYVEYTAYRRLRPEDTWKRYELFGIAGLPEQLLLERAAKKLFRCWKRKRPSIFNKDRKKREINE